MNVDLNDAMHQRFRSLNPIDEESAFDFVAPVSVATQLLLIAQWDYHEGPGAGFARNPLVKLSAGFTLVELKLHWLSSNEWWR